MTLNDSLLSPPKEANCIDLLSRSNRQQQSPSTASGSHPVCGTAELLRNAQNVICYVGKANGLFMALSITANDQPGEPGSWSNNLSGQKTLHKDIRVYSTRNSAASLKSVYLLEILIYRDMEGN